MPPPPFAAWARRIALCLAVACAGCRGGDVAVQYTEQQEQEAIEQAQATLDQFLQRFLTPQPGDTDFFLRVRIYDGENAEHAWFGHIAVVDEEFTGLITQAPQRVKGVLYGVPHAFTRDDIVDWMYRADGVVHGNHILRIALQNMPERQARPIREQMGW
jgi:uncharacterized protein YegJ (DUF2314 family)